MGDFRNKLSESDWTTSLFLYFVCNKTHRATEMVIQKISLEDNFRWTKIAQNFNQAVNLEGACESKGLRPWYSLAVKICQEKKWQPKEAFGISCMLPSPCRIYTSTTGIYHRIDAKTHVSKAPSPKPPRVPSSIPTEGNFFYWIYFALPCVSLYCQRYQNHVF